MIKALELMNEALEILEGSGLICAAAQLSVAIDTVSTKFANDNDLEPGQIAETVA